MFIFKFFLSLNFFGLARTATGCLLEAVVEAVVEASLTATVYNFQRILFLNDCGGLFTTLNSKTASD